MAAAIYQGVHEAVIIDGRVPHSILLELCLLYTSTLKFGAKYEDYLLGTSFARPCIAKALADIRCV